MLQSTAAEGFVLPAWIWFLFALACKLFRLRRLSCLLGVQANSSASSQEALHGILSGRPVLALAFDDMEMTVNRPEVVQVNRQKSVEQKALRPALAWAMAN